MVWTRMFLSCVVFVATAHFCGPAVAEDDEVVFSLQNGDTNADGDTDVSDVVRLLGFLYTGDAPPAAALPIEAEFVGVKNGDTNGDGEIDVSDAIGLLSWLYMGGPAPVPFWRSDLGEELAAGGEGAGLVERRPIEDFVSQQGTFCIPDGMGGCLLRIPPVPNFIFWTDPAALLCAVVDYAGLVNGVAGGLFGTATTGEVLERRLPDGRAEVEVRLLTSNAPFWVHEAVADPDGGFAGCDPNAGATVFGQRIPDALASGEATLGRSFLKFRFINTAPGAPLPDLLQLVIFPQPGQEGPSELLTVGQATGLLPDGRHGRATNFQFAKDGDGDGFAEDVLREDISVRP